MKHWNPQTVFNDDAAPADMVNMVQQTMGEINLAPHS